MNARRIISIWDTQGAGAFLLEEGLRSKGWDVRVYVRRLLRNTFDHPYRKSIFQINLNSLEQETRWQPKKVLTGILFRLWLFWILRSAKDYTVLFHFGQTGAKYVSLVPDRHRVYVFFYGHDISAALTSKRWRRKYKKLFKPNVIAIVMCKEAKERLIDFGWCPDRIEIWNLPVNFSAMRRQKRIRRTESPLKIITCARFVDKKGYPALFRTLKRFRELEFDFKLTIFGFGEGKKALESLAIEYGIFEQIEWVTGLTGDDFDIAYDRALLESDIFVLLAKTAENGDDEGGPPLSLVQAQYSGIPVVVTRYTGWEITIEDQISGILVAGEIEDATLEVLKRATFDYEWLSAIGLEGSRRAELEFSPEGQISLLNQILSRR